MQVFQTLIKHSLRLRASAPHEAGVIKALGIAAAVMIALRGDQGKNHLVVFVGYKGLDDEASSVRSPSPISHRHDGQFEEQHADKHTHAETTS